MSANDRRLGGFGSRILAGQVLVLGAGALTTAVVAALVGPPIFHDHLMQAGQSASSPELDHIEMAYRDASLLSLGVSLVVSLVVAAAVTWFMAQRVRRPLDSVIEAAQAFSSGNFATRVTRLDSGTELDTLADAFNAMAARLEGVEDTRRRMLADLAHELRTPIATMSAYHEGLHDGIVGLDQESRTVLAGQIARLTRLADDIDEVSSAQEGRLRLVPRRHLLGAILEATADAHRERYAAKGVGLQVTSPPGLFVIADEHRIGQVFANLLTNALRHTPPGGRVRVMASHGDGTAIVEVVDDGDGIRAEHLPHLFERFYRGDAARNSDEGGSGIGLTISQAIVAAHSGTISAASEGQGKGATLTITLPLSS